jgi:hypothetical protein
MKKVLMFFSLVFLCTVNTAHGSTLSSLLGIDSITSSTPNNMSIIYLDPGQVQDFAVTVQQSPSMAAYSYTDQWRINNLNGTESREDEGSKLVHPDGTNPLKVSYHPNSLSPGSYQIIYFREYVRNNAPVWDYPRLDWMVVVRGIEVLPEPGTKVTTGSTTKYAATAYPSGLYAYIWFLDGVQVKTGKTFTYAPTKTGIHLLNVVATSYLGKISTFSRIITVVKP